MNRTLESLSALTSARTRLTSVLAIAACLLVLGTVAVGTTGATHGDEPTSHFEVAIDRDGSATVSLVETFDLTDAERRDAFQSLDGDDSAKTEFRTRFADRMRSVATAATDETGREMTVSDATITATESADGRTGIVTLTVSWSNLAARKDGQLVVTKPFDGGFSPSRTFVITAPEGYHIAEASPSPDVREPTQASWAAGTSLDGYRVVFEETAEEHDTTRTSGQPGFGLVAGLTALSTTLWALGRRSDWP